MNWLDLLTAAAFLVWLFGVGLLAHAIPRWMEQDLPDYIRVALSLFSERVAVLLAIVIVAWPLALPTLIIMQAVRKKQ